MFGYIDKNPEIAGLAEAMLFIAFLVGFLCGSGLIGFIWFAVAVRKARREERHTV